MPPFIISLMWAFLMVGPLFAAAQPLNDNAHPDLKIPPVARTAKSATPVYAAEKRAPSRRARRADKVEPRQNMPATSARAVQKRAPSRRARIVDKAQFLKKEEYSSFLCPGKSVACPVYAGENVTAESVSALEDNLSSLDNWFEVGFECMELDSELNSCGGCLALGAG